MTAATRVFAVQFWLIEREGERRHVWASRRAKLKDARAEGGRLHFVATARPGLLYDGMTLTRGELAVMLAAGSVVPADPADGGFG